MTRDEAQAKMATDLMNQHMQIQETINEYRLRGGTAQELIDALAPFMRVADESVLQYIVAAGLAGQVRAAIKADERRRGSA